MNTKSIGIMKNTEIFIANLPSHTTGVAFMIFIANNDFFKLPTILNQRYPLHQGQLQLCQSTEPKYSTEPKGKKNTPLNAVFCLGPL